METIESFEPGSARGEDLLLLQALTKELLREGWTDIVHWAGGVRAAGQLRHTTFGVLHLKFLKETTRRALVRQAVLRLLEERARSDFGDQLCLVSDANVDSASLGLLSSAGIELRSAPAFAGRAKTVAAGTAGTSFKMRGPRPPVSVVHDIRGSDHRKATRRIGYGVGYVRVRLRIQGDGEMDIPGSFTVESVDDRYQNGILIKGIRAKLNVDLTMDLFCLNREARSSSSSARCRLGPWVDDARIGKLIARVDRKAVNGKRPRQVVQDAVWEITEDGKLSRETDDALERLPDAPR